MTGLKLNFGGHINFGAMNLKEACRATGHWPDVIADLIAGYACRTVREKVIKLAGPYIRGGEIITHGRDLYLWWSVREGRRTIPEIGYLRVIEGARICLSMTRQNFVQSVIARRWLDSHGLARPMDALDNAVLDSWLSSIE